MTARDLTKALRGHWHGSYGTARCPAHDDHNPSLSISERNGKLLVCCHAGCDQADVWEALKDQRLVESAARLTCQTSPRSRPVSHGKQPNQNAEAKATFAKRIWEESRPAAGTPVKRYAESRDISIELPPTLRYHPGLKHKPTGLFLPAMVAAVMTQT